MSKYVSAADAVKVVKSGDRVYLHAAAAAPTILSNALTERAFELVKISHPNHQESIEKGYYELCNKM